MRKSVCFTDDLKWKVLLRHGYKREDKKGFLKKERVKKEHVSKQVRLQRNKSQKKRQKAISLFPVWMKWDVASLQASKKKQSAITPVIVFSLSLLFKQTIWD